jgi:CO dehydrogenase nickel-insertion accessory protein CooC1
MIKLGLQIMENEKDVNIKVIDPTKKQLETATENEKLIAQAFKELFNESLVNLMSEKINKNNEN